MQDNKGIIVARGVKKNFGKIEALSGVDLSVNAGKIFALLGPNGAGKTTLVRIFATLLSMDAGYAKVAGFDVVREANHLRYKIGLAGQYAAIDGNLTGRENLRLIGKLYHLSRKETKKRTDELLERFLLSDASNRTAKTYSGGMRRRLDLAASLIGKPNVLFLDEPTTGLDPQSRINLWDMIRGLAREGSTMLLTTQYLEEADKLSDEIAVMDRGKIIAQGTSENLKSKVGGEVLEFEISDKATENIAIDIITKLCDTKPRIDNNTKRIILPLPISKNGPLLLAEALRRLDIAGIKLSHLALIKPSLDDVFLSLTGHATSPQ